MNGHHRWQERLLPKLEKRVSAHADIYYFHDTTAAKDIDRVVDRREEAIGEIMKFLGLDPGCVRIRLVLFEDDNTKARETGYRGEGWAEGDMAIELYGPEGRCDPYHETTHILASRLGDPPKAFYEGLAVYIAERFGKGRPEQEGQPPRLYDRARASKQSESWLTLEMLLTCTEFGGHPARYAQAGAFVKFLIDEYGKGLFLRAYTQLRVPADEMTKKQNKGMLDRLYGMSMDELERQWHKALGV